MSERQPFAYELRNLHSSSRTNPYCREIIQQKSLNPPVEVIKVQDIENDFLDELSTTINQRRAQMENKQAINHVY